jgi:adenine phosphoribosyltransferase
MMPGHPRPGIMFRDVTTLFRDREGFRRTLDAFAARYAGSGIGKVAGIEARGFILGGALADRLGAGFVPIRKRGKLPADTIGHDYELEYGSDRVEIHVDAVADGERVLLVDDLIATGGTALAGAALINQLGGRLVEACFIIDLPALGGRRRLEAAGVGVFTLMEFEGE